jgi:hypothetical protein
MQEKEQSIVIHIFTWIVKEKKKRSKKEKKGSSDNSSSLYISKYSYLTYKWGTS